MDLGRNPFSCGINLVRGWVGKPVPIPGVLGPAMFCINKFHRKVFLGDLLLLGEPEHFFHQGLNPKGSTTNERCQEVGGIEVLHNYSYRKMSPISTMKGKTGLPSEKRRNKQ